jgi:hypothetical protein
VGDGSPWPLPSRVFNAGLVYKVLMKKLYANNIGSTVLLFSIFFSIFLMHLLKEYLGNSWQTMKKLTMKLLQILLVNLEIEKTMRIGQN